MQNHPSHTIPVLIIGGGPVGLFLALCLTRLNIECRVLEQKTGIDHHSKSLGIHPVSLELFDRLDFTQPFIEAGIKIRRGHAFTNGTRIGTLTFDNCPPPHRYVLSLPQHRTEHILEKGLQEANPGCLIRGATVTHIRNRTDYIEVEFAREGSSHLLNGYRLVGSDGIRSLVRRSAGISFTGKMYPDTYLMGDFSDNTGFGSDAAIYLHRDGLVESFPVPDNMRRWVAKTDRYMTSPDRDYLEKLVQHRTGHSIQETTNTMLSAFGVQHCLVETFYKRNIFLAGDAAHIVSPIGGQGMNLGWLDAWTLAETLHKSLSSGAKPEALFSAWSAGRRKIAEKCAERAEWNMKMGRKRTHPIIRNGVARMMITPPLDRIMARIFTMRGLG